jgi:hypothetical protein
MSLDVSPALLEQAERGPVDESAFVETVRASLPYAYDMVARLAGELRDSTGKSFADNVIPPETEAQRGQLLRALASDSIKAGLERHFGVRLAFQNCHRLAAFRPADAGGEVWRDFTSIRSQLLNQTPELRNC